jgi:hypothetical protein
VPTSPIQMRRVSDWIRNHIESCYGLLPPITVSDIQEHSSSRIEPTIYKHAQDRIEMGYVRYESKLGVAPDYLERIKKMVDKYESTRNREFLVDALNFVLLEWTTPTIPDTFFETEDGVHKSDDFVFPSP